MSRHNSDIASIWHSDIHTDFWDTDILIAKKREELRQIRAAKNGMSNTTSIQFNTQNNTNAIISDEELANFQKEIGRKNSTAQSSEVGNNVLSIKRERLIEWVSKLELKIYSTGKTVVLVYTRLSGAYDKITKKPFLKFENKNMEYIWNGVLEWREVRWYQRTKKWNENYISSPKIESLKIQYVTT